MPVLRNPSCWFCLKRLAGVALLMVALLFPWPALGQESHVYRENASRLAQQAMAHLRENRPMEAIQLLQQAIKLDPYSAATASHYNNLGLAYRQVNQPELAMVSFQFAMRLQPDFALYYQNLVGSWQQADRLEAARAQLEQFTQQYPLDGSAWLLLGYVYQAAGQSTAQQRAWQQFLALEPYSAMRPAICQQVLGCTPER